MVANAYLEGTYSELYPHVGRRRGGTARALPPVLVPGRDPEPRRAGDARARSTRAASSATRSRTPTARRSTTRTCSSRCVVGDGEAETGPLATSWHSNKFLNPQTRRRGAADPAPERLQDRQPDGARADPGGRAASRCSRATATGRSSSPATSRSRCTRRSRRRSTRRSTTSPRFKAARASGRAWPMIVLRTPKGWTGPKEVDGLPVEGTWRSHQVPLADAREQRRAPAQLLEEWLRSYRPEELFDEQRRARPRARGARRRRATGG